MKLFNYNGLVIDEQGNAFKVSELLHNGEDIFAKISSGSLVLLLCENSIDSLFFYINCIERKVVPILIDSNSHPSLIENLINIYSPDFIFVPSSNSNNFINYDNFYNHKSYKIVTSCQNIPKNLNPLLALLLSTSGSTGSPKLVRLSYSNLVSNASSISKYLNIKDTDKAISSLPMNYSFGLSIINSHLFIGGSVLMTNESITQRKFWELFNNFNITSFSGVPYTFEILKKFKLLNIETPSLKKITQAGGKLTNELIEFFANFSIKKGIDFFVMYGQTEGTARLSYLPTEYLIKKLGSIGRPIPGGDFFLFDENGNKINTPGTTGELIYNGPNVMLGYADILSDLSIGDINKGMLKTGDIAYFDKDEFYFIVGRIKRFIKIFGNRISLDELETLLKTSAIDSACVGKDDLLVIYLLNDDKKTFVKELITKKIGIHHTAIDIRVINEFPRNETGKIIYSKLLL